MTHSRNPLRLLAPALLLAFVAVSSVAIPANAAPQVISIAEARTLPPGTVVTVDGSVTTPSGAFDSSFFDYGFGLQDKSAGIYVSLQTDLGVAPRRQARVTGTLQDSFGLLLLVPADPSDVKLHGAGPRVAAAMGHHRRRRRVDRGADRPRGRHDHPGAGERSPLRLQVLRRRRLGRAADLRQHPDRDRPERSRGRARSVSVTGFSSQFDTHYEIDPRVPGRHRGPVPLNRIAKRGARARARRGSRPEIGSQLQASGSPPPCPSSPGGCPHPP